jgi:aspartate ammonia-lyase
MPAAHCVSFAWTASKQVCRTHLERSIGLVTALNPHIGYDKSTELAAEAQKTGKGIVELVREKKILSEEKLKEIMYPKNMIGNSR